METIVLKKNHSVKIVRPKACTGIGIECLVEEDDSVKQY